MDSLRLLQAEQIELICPGHGPWITDPAAKLAEYVEHREMRERRLLAALERGERSRAALLAEVWDDVPVELLPVAAMAMEAHLEKLEAEGRLPGRSRPPADTCILAGQLASTHSAMSGEQRAVRAGLLAGAAGTGLAAAATAAAWHWLARRPLPKQKGTIELDGLEGPVRVRRDRWGVPHIEADAAADLYFAQGFCHGQDRLWQMDFYRRVVRGRVSEMAGEEGLPVDRLMRTLGIRRVAEREAAALDPELRALLERFCAGVNAAAASARALPFEMQLLRLEFEPWRPVDILSLGKLLAFGLSTNWERELLRADMLRALGPELTARLDPAYPADNPVVTQEAWRGDGLAIVEQIDAVRRSMGLAAEASGSNNWAVCGRSAPPARR